MPDEQKPQQQQTPAATTPAAPPDAAKPTPASFEEWLGAQDETIKSLYESHTAGLKSALQSERTQRQELAKQLNAAAKKQGVDEGTQQALTEMASRLEEAETRASFFEDAARPETGCSNAFLAYLTAQNIGAIDKKGRVNWAAIKEVAPELFGRKTTPAGNAGAGTQQQQPAAANMNTWIRRAAGQ